MKSKPLATKTITAISTTINGHTEYISGQSVRDFDGRYLPQFTTRTVHAKEFENEDDAHLYLQKIVNNFHRQFNIVSIEIPDIKDLKKYDRDYKKQQRQITGHHYHGGLKDGARLRGLLITLIAIVLVTYSCSKKSYAPAPQYIFDHYQLIAEHYTLDTAFIQRYVLWRHDSVWKQETKSMLDTIAPRWWLMCATEKLPMRLEYWYYTKNGKIIK